MKDTRKSGDSVAMTTIRARVPITNAKDFAFSVAHGNNNGNLAVDFIELDVENLVVTLRGSADIVARALSFLEGAGVIDTCAPAGARCLLDHEPAFERAVTSAKAIFNREDVAS